MQLHRGRLNPNINTQAIKTAYKTQLSNTKIGNLVVDLSGVEYLDSSALGMLLVLRDHVQAANKSLTLSKPSAITSRTFDIAGFDRLFTIN
jgi:anti-anti-sigma factor